MKSTPSKAEEGLPPVSQPTPLSRSNSLQLLASVPSTPLKSILKKRPMVHAPLTSAPTAEHPRSTPKEPQTFSQKARKYQPGAQAVVVSIFQSPMFTLAESMSEQTSVDVHDIAQAYGVLAVRIRGSVGLLWDPAVDSKVWLSPLQSDAQILATCLRRDLARPVTPAQSTQSQSLGSFASTQTPSDDEVKASHDTNSVCQAALLLAGDILSIPLLLSLFKHEDLSRIFSVVVRLVTSHAPSIISDGHCPLALRVITIPGLPAHLLLENMNDILVALGKILSLSADAHEEHQALIAHAHLSLRSFLRPDSGIPLPKLVNFLPTILSSLASPLDDLRASSVEVLLAFVAAKFDAPLLATDMLATSIAKQVSKFLNNDRRMAVQEPVENNLTSILRKSIMPPSSAQTPVRIPPASIGWTVTTLSCLMVLLDYTVFHNAPSLKTILEMTSIGKEERHVRHERLPEIWRCVVWCMGRAMDRVKGIPVNADEMDTSASNTADLTQQEINPNYSHKIFDTVVQRTASSITTIAMALSKSDQPSCITLVIKEVGKLVQRGHESGIPLFVRLMSGIGILVGEILVKRDWKDNAVLPVPFLNGHFLRLQPEEERTFVMEQIEVDDVRTLTEQEIFQNWEPLLQIWQHAVEQHLSLRTETTQFNSDTAIRFWQSLLLVQSQLTQGLENFTAPPAVVNAAIVALVTYIRPTRPLKAQVYLTRLGLTRKLWGVMENVFGHGCLSGPADSLLSAILELHGMVGKESWAAFCGTLLLHASWNVSKVFWTREHDVPLKREIWSSLVQSIVQGRSGYNWEACVEVAVIPLGHWEADKDLWEKLIERAVSSAKSSVSVVQMIFNAWNGFGQAHGFANVVLARLDPTGLTSIPPETLTILANLSPDADTGVLLHRFQLIRTWLERCQPSLLPYILQSLAPSISLWLRKDGEEGSMCKDGIDTEAHIASLVVSGMRSLQSLPPSADNLKLIDSFVCLSFERRAPGILLDAFEDFWRATYNREMEMELVAEHGSSTLCDGIEAMRLTQSPVQRFAAVLPEADVSDASDSELSEAPDSQGETEDEGGVFCGDHSMFFNETTRLSLGVSEPKGYNEVVEESQPVEEEEATSQELSPEYLPPPLVAPPPVNFPLVNYQSSYSLDDQPSQKATPRDAQSMLQEVPPIYYHTVSRSSDAKSLKRASSSLGSPSKRRKVTPPAQTPPTEASFSKLPPSKPRTRSSNSQSQAHPLAIGSMQHTPPPSVHNSQEFPDDEDYDSFEHRGIPTQRTVLFLQELQEEGGADDESRSISPDVASMNLAAIELAKHGTQDYDDPPPVKREPVESSITLSSHERGMRRSQTVPILPSEPTSSKLRAHARAAKADSVRAEASEMGNETLMVVWGVFNDEMGRRLPRNQRSSL